MTVKTLTDKRRDPNYVQVTGYVPKDIGRRFKMACGARDIDRTIGIEEAINLWLDLQEANGVIPARNSQQSQGNQQDSNNKEAK